MAATTMVHVRVNERTTARATKALPFNRQVPNATTAAAMEDARRGGLESFDSVPDLMANLNEEY